VRLNVSPDASSDYPGTEPLDPPTLFVDDATQAWKP